MKRTIKILALVLVAVILVCGISLLLEYTRTTSSDKAVTVNIRKGASEKEIARVLKENGVIDYEITFRLKMKTSPYRGKLNYGEYILYEKMSLDDVIETLAKPSTLAESIRLTIPEGYSAKMIAALCEEKGIATSEEFLNELKEGQFDYDFIKDIPDNPNVEYKLEGYLFPSTHFLKKDATAHDVIDTLLREFEKQYNSVKGDLPEGMTMNEAIIRASLVEREAKLDSEREIISGVIDNRLAIDMILQIDASVVYAISDGMYDVERVLYRDLEMDSPYNTYKYTGLPAGAICNPGIESIRAAMNPQEHKYLFYHTDTKKNDGSHIFTETYSEHLSK